jgi:cell division protein FtsA
MPPASSACADVGKVIMTVVPLARRERSTKQSDKGPKIVAALDIGTTKTCCMIGEVVPGRRTQTGEQIESRVKVLGMGHQAARGVKGGVVVDLDEAERAIRVAVDQAERMARQTITEVFVNVSGGRPLCQGFVGSAETGGEAVRPEHMNEAVARALASCDPGRRVLLHATPVRFGIDDAKGVERPEGMFGETLSVDLNVVTVERGALRNLTLAIERCHLKVGAFVIAPYAAAKAALVDDEQKLGTILIEMGGATTSIAVLQDGALCFADVIPVGGQHITNDLARGLSTTIAHAERLKTMAGSAMSAICDEREMIAVPLLGERGPDKVHRVPRSMLTGIIRPRLEETFELVRDRLRQEGAASAARRVVLSGGSSQLLGARELAAQILEKQVRAHRSIDLMGLPDLARSPAFAVAAGLLRYALNPDRHLSLRGRFGEDAGSYLLKVGKWIKESF